MKLKIKIAILTICFLFSIKALSSLNETTSLYFIRNYQVPVDGKEYILHYRDEITSWSDKPFLCYVRTNSTSLPVYLLEPRPDDLFYGSPVYPGNQVKFNSIIWQPFKDMTFPLHELEIINNGCDLAKPGCISRSGSEDYFDIIVRCTST